MATDVISLFPKLSMHKEDPTAINGSTELRSTVTLMTRDLLGNGGIDQSLELSLNSQVLHSRAKHLDSKLGKMYMQQCKSSIHRSRHHHHHRVREFDHTFSKTQDLNFPPNLVKSPAKPLLRLFDDTSSSIFQSVCTLDKVKLALERAERHSIKKRRSPYGGVCDRNASAAAVASGCPRCLSYVLVVKSNPKCPRCRSFVPLLDINKKRKIDLNISI